MTADLRLIQQGIYDGNEMALTGLYRLFYSKLHYFSQSIVRSPEDAEEIVEDVFVKLWANRQQITTIENLSVYLYVAVKNRSFNLMTRKGRTISSPDLLAADSSIVSSDPYKLLVEAEMLTRMQAAIELLPPRCKLIFRLIREDGLQYREVAEILNISINTIDAQMAIATKKICTLLSRQDPDITGKHRTRTSGSKDV